MCFSRLCIVCDLDLWSHAFLQLNMNSTIKHDFDVCAVCCEFGHFVSCAAAHFSFSSNGC